MSTVQEYVRRRLGPKDTPSHRAFAVDMKTLLLRISSQIRPAPMCRFTSILVFVIRSYRFSEPPETTSMDKEDRSSHERKTYAHRYISKRKKKTIAIKVCNMDASVTHGNDFYRRTSPIRTPSDVSTPGVRIFCVCNAAAPASQRHMPPPSPNERRQGPSRGRRAYKKN